MSTWKKIIYKLKKSPCENGGTWVKGEAAGGPLGQTGKPRA